MAHFNKGDPDAAEKLLIEARHQFPQNETLLEVLRQMYLTANRLTNALAIVDEQLKLRPDNLETLLNKAYLCMKLEAYELASAAVAPVRKHEPDHVRAL